jgi:hypothetical protein
MGSSGKLSRVAGMRLSIGSGVKLSNSGAGFSDAIQFEMWLRASSLRSTNRMPALFFDSASHTICAEISMLCPELGN